MLGAYLSTLILTLTSPTTILLFAALFAGLGLGGDGLRPATAPAIVLGVFLGSTVWWLTLTDCIAIARRLLTSRLVRSVHTLSGLALPGFGLMALVRLLPQP